MRVAFINNKIPRSNGFFWAKKFNERSNDFLHLSVEKWNLEALIRFKPDHIHFNSAAQPIEKWIPLDKINNLRNHLPNVPITWYYCDAFKSFEHRIKLNGLLDAAFCSYDNNEKTIWMPVPGDVNFWVVERNEKPKHNIIFIGNQYAAHSEKQGVPFTRAQTLKAVSRHFNITIVGGGWEKYKLQHFRPTDNYRQTRQYYYDSKIGLNVINEGYRKLGKCWSNRLTHMMLCGLPCFTPYMPRIERVLTHMEHVIFYQNDQDLVKLLKVHSDNDLLLRRIAENGQKKAISIMNMDIAVRKILDVKRKR